VVTFNPSKAYENSQAEIAALLKVTKEEAAQYVGEFSFQIEEISRFVPAELNQEFFDQVFGNDVVSSLDEFRVKVKENIMNQHSSESDYRFLLDVRTYLENKVGALEFPNELLKRIMLANNKDKGADYVEEHFDKSIEELKWHLIKEQLVKANDVKIDDNDLKETAKQATRFQFAQYGMANIPEEYIEQYAAEMLKNKEQVNGLLERCIENKLIAVLKNVVTLDHKNISVEDFGKLFA
jgi:trigger factor